MVIILYVVFTIYALFVYKKFRSFLPNVDVKWKSNAVVTAAIITAAFYFGFEIYYLCFYATSIIWCHYLLFTLMGTTRMSINDLKRLK